MQRILGHDKRRRRRHDHRERYAAQDAAGGPQVLRGGRPSLREDASEDQDRCPRGADGPQDVLRQAGRGPAGGRVLRVLHRPRRPHPAPPGRRHHPLRQEHALLQGPQARVLEGVHRTGRQKSTGCPTASTPSVWSTTGPCSGKPAWTPRTRRARGRKSARPPRRSAPWGTEPSDTPTTARTTRAAGTSPPGCTRWAATSR